MKTDVATNLYFPRDQYDRMKEIAKRLKISIAEYVRRVLDKDIETRTKEIDWKRDSLWNIVGAVRGGDPCIAEKHDAYLYGGKKKK